MGAPLQVQERAAALSEYLDNVWVQIPARLRFRIGFSDEGVTLREKKNHRWGAGLGRVWDVGTVVEAKARHIHWSPFPRKSSRVSG